MHNRS